MMKKYILLLALATVVVPLSCEKETKVIGTLLLQPGQTGDVQNCRVELYEKADLTGTPVKFVASKASGQANRSDFEFTDVIEGYYYLLAWKDLNGDGVVSDKDIVGVHGGFYRPGYGGTQITVKAGQINDVGEIEMLIYKELKISASGSRSGDHLTTTFTYSFNYDVTLTSLTITFPGYQPVQDPDAPGTKTAGTQYTSGPWHDAGGNPMPTGTHTLQFVGSWEGTSFDITVTVVIN